MTSAIRSSPGLKGQHAPRVLKPAYFTIRAVTGAGLLRSHLISLMLEENGVHDAGALHLSRVLTEEQMQIVSALPSPTASRSAVVEAHRACAKVFLPCAKSLAERLNIAWPDEFAAA